MTNDTRHCGILIKVIQEKIGSSASFVSIQKVQYLEAFSDPILLRYTLKMPVLVILIGIACLMLLIMRFKLNAFIALTLVAIGVGLAMGMGAEQVLKSMQSGVGGTLGSLAFILGFGAMLGGIIADSGAASVISSRLTSAFGLKYLPWAMILTGFIVGVPMFYTVAFLVVLPIIFETARQSKLPLLFVGLPMISALSVTHGFLPPHPAPTTIVEFYGANMQKTLLLGIVVAIPAIIAAGVLFSRVFRHKFTPIPDSLFGSAGAGKSAQLYSQKPGFGLAVLTALTPVILMALAGLVGEFIVEPEHPVAKALEFIGHPVTALLFSVLLASYTLGVKQGTPLKTVMERLPGYVKPIAMIMLIIAGGGAFKQVLVDSGASNYIVTSMETLAVSPLLMAWLLAAALRITLGSATVAALTAAGMVLPLVEMGDVNAELLVLATGAGSLTCSQLNDTGFWLFKEYFNLSVVETLKSWTVMETIVSIVGLIGCLVLDIFI